MLIAAPGLCREYGSLVTNRTISVNSSGFAAAPELFRPDGDTAIIFLVGNGIVFYEQTEDPWYRGRALGYEIVGNELEGSHRIYYPEEAASPLGCVQQFQFCNGALAPDKRCGPLAGWNDALHESEHLFDVAGSGAAVHFHWVVTQLNNVATDLHTLLQTLGSKSLASNAKLFQGIMGRLPPNQWQLDVTHWWSTYLASVQAAFVATAIGPADPTGELEQYKLLPDNDQLRNLCNNQVRKTLQESPSSLCIDLNGVILSITATATQPRSAIDFLMGHNKRDGR